MRRCAILCLVSVLTAGCGTFLEVRSTSVEDPAPPGIVLNHVTEYEVKVTQRSESPLNGAGADQAPKIGAKPLRLVDQDRLAAYNIRRMPFSSGKLSLKVDSQHVLKEIGLTSATGVPRAAEAGKAAAESAAAIEAAKAKAESGGAAE